MYLEKTYALESFYQHFFVKIKTKINKKKINKKKCVRLLTKLKQFFFFLNCVMKGHKQFINHETINTLRTKYA